MSGVRSRVALGVVLLLRAASSNAICLALPADLTWPGPPPCDGALQACVDAEPCNGGILEIASDEPISEAISFQKGLTIRPAPGFHPLIAAFVSAGTPSGSIGKGGAYLIHIEGLTFEGSGAVLVSQNSPSLLIVEVVGNTVVNAVPSPQYSAISLSQGTGSGAISFDISGNAVTVPVYPFVATGISLIVLPPGSGGRIASNTVAVEGGQYTGGILLLENSGNSWSADVVANRVTGSGDGAGIELVSTGGDIAARLLDNLVVGQPNPTPLGVGISLDVADAGITATVVNNTVAANQVGVRAFSENGTGAIGGLVANNLVYGNGQAGVSIDAAFAGTLANRNNLVYGNGMESFTPGPGTVTLDPRFAGGGDYHLLPDSPAIDAGASSAVPSDLLADLDGSPRIEGHRVDIGAYEAPEPTGALGGGAALLALAGAVRGRQRRLPTR